MKPDAVATANLAGRLHPSQRSLLIGGRFRFGLAVVLIAVAVVLPLTTSVLDGPHRARPSARCRSCSS